jgi:4-amino-4-deoxy-L-arabinose transferase-like glycosyltransferase
LKPETRNLELQTGSPRPWPKWAEPVLLAAILVLAAGLRTYDLNRLPPGLWFDEGLAGLNALSILHDGHFRLYFDNRAFFDGKATNAEEPMFQYLLALSIAILGPTVLALRLVSALVGVLTIGVFYGMVRAIWDRRMALLSALLLAMCRWHLHFSRTVFRTILVPLFACLFLWLWWNGVERHRKSHLILAGIVLGFGFYTYFACQLLVPAWLCYWFIRWWREKERRRELIGALVWPALVAFVVLLPLFGYFIKNPDVASGRLGSLSIFEQKQESPSMMQLAPEQRAGSPADILAKNLWANVHHFWWRGDHVAKHNVPYMAVFDPVTSVVFALGLLTALFGIRRDSRNALILLWAGWLACASICSLGAPNLLRTLGMVPAVVLILANGYTLIGRTIAKQASRATAALALVLLIGWFGTNEACRYFVTWRNNSDVPREFNTVYRQLCEGVIARFDADDVYIPADYYDYCSVRYLLYGRTNMHQLSLPDSFVRQPNATRDRILIYTPWTFPPFGPDVPPPSRWFPKGRLVWGMDEPPFFNAFEVPAENLMTPERAVQALRGFQINPNR